MTRQINSWYKQIWMKKKSHQTLCILFPVFSSKSITSHFQFTLTSMAYIPTRTLSNISCPSPVSASDLSLLNTSIHQTFLSLICLLACSLALTNTLEDSEQKHRNILCVFVCTVLCYNRSATTKCSSVISPSLRTGQNTQKVTSKTDVWLLYFFNT